MSAAGTSTFVVTGASSGIGREIALELAAPGREIWLIGRSRERLMEVAEAIGAKGATAMLGEVDLENREEAAAFLETHFPPERKVDAVYLAAAVSLFGEASAMRREDWVKIYQTNLLAVTQWCHHFYKGMVARRGGTIVMIGSLVAYAGYPTSTAYATMKAGLLGLFKSLRYEGKDYGVSLHLVSPGYVATGIFKHAIFRGTTYEKTMGEIKASGFSIEPADRIAKSIIRGVARGKAEFAIPLYAVVVKWVAPRFPFVIDVIHDSMMKRFRRNPSGLKEP